jgi:hypothetical protein
MGFTQSDNILLVGVYVDDLVITGSSLATVEEFKEEMKVFLMSNLGFLSFYLGIEVCQNAGSITLRQTHYARKILEIVHMADYKASATPMEERLRLSSDSTAEEVYVTKYRRIMGSLRYLVHTQTDLAYAIGYVSQFLEWPLKNISRQ